LTRYAGDDNSALFKMTGIRSKERPAVAGSAALACLQLHGQGGMGSSWLPAALDGPFPRQKPV